MFVNVLVDIEQVEVLRKVRRKLRRVRTGLVSDDTFGTVNCWGLPLGPGGCELTGSYVHVWYSCIS
jgi:hypothetical protein